MRPLSAARASPARSGRPHARAGEATSPTDRVVAFHGDHQAGIETPRQQYAAFLAADVTAGSRGDLALMLKLLTQGARALTAGGRPPDAGIGVPPSDDGTLGPVVPADGLTVTVGLGSGVFDDRFGLAGRRPRRLRPMDTFPNDDLDPAQCHGDVMLQLCADHPDTVMHAQRQLLKLTRGLLQPRWRVDGFASPARPSGAPRNLLGFKDGIAHPAYDDFDSLVWTGAGGAGLGRRRQLPGRAGHPDARGVLGPGDDRGAGEDDRPAPRHRGARCPGSAETDTPDYPDDPVGATTPLDAHIRLANPRTPQSAPSQLLRRGYNYDRGLDVNGNLDCGLVFACYQQDLDRAFVDGAEAAGRRAAGRLHLTGRRRLLLRPARASATPSDWYGRALLA